MVEQEEIERAREHAVFFRGVFGRRGSVVGTLLSYIVAVAFLVATYLIVFLYFDQKPIPIFVGLFLLFTSLMIFGVVRGLTRKRSFRRK